jgi:hypothetical protein
MEPTWNQHLTLQVNIASHWGSESHRNPTSRPRPATVVAAGSGVVTARWGRHSGCGSKGEGHPGFISGHPGSRYTARIYCVTQTGAAVREMLLKGKDSSKTRDCCLILLAWPSTTPLAWSQYANPGLWNWLRPSKKTPPEWRNTLSGKVLTRLLLMRRFQLDCPEKSRKHAMLYSKRQTNCQILWLVHEAL